MQYIIPFFDDNPHEHKKYPKKDMYRTKTLHTVDFQFRICNSLMVAFKIQFYADNYKIMIWEISFQRCDKYFTIA